MAPGEASDHLGAAGMIRAGESKKMPPMRCLNPGCRKMLDAATALATGGIKPGDVSLCIYCGHLMVLGDNHRLREPTTAEMHDMAGDPRILQAQAARLTVMGTKRR
jgi:hypothetical protein